MPDSVPSMMQAIAIREPGGPDVLVPKQISTPEAGQGEVLIKVAAAGINRPDVMQRIGLYPPPPGAPDTPGLEVSGTIAVIGSGVSGLSVGDRVCALVSGGGYAEYCVAPAPQVLPVPDNLDMVAAAGVPETFFTVWSNVFDRARLEAGESFLVHGGTSGIGTTAIQLAHAFGARVLATAGSDDKCAVCRDLGADRAINYRSEDFVSVTKEFTGGKGVDVILDMVGGDYAARNIDCMAEDGRLVYIAFLEGFKVKMNLMPIMLKRLTLTGSTLRPRSVAEKAAIAQALREKVWPLLAEGKIRPVIDSTFALSEAAKAHARMDAAHIGKIILKVAT